MSQKYFRVRRPGRSIHVAGKIDNHRYKSLCGRLFAEDGNIFVAETVAVRGDECKRCQHCRTKRHGWAWEGIWRSGSCYSWEVRLPLVEHRDSN